MTRKHILSFVGILLAMAMTLVVKAAENDTSSLEGKAAPDFTFKTLDGKELTLSKEKGNVVVLDYWATWCPPCRKSLPHVQKLNDNKDQAGKGLKVYAINNQETQDQVKQFVEQNKYTFTVAMDPDGKFGKDYLVAGIPTTVIVGRDGMIKKVFIGYGDGSDEPMEKAIEDALKEEKKS